MRLAAIDIGTNSLHMIVVRVRADLSFEVIDREKEMVRLGAGGLDGRALTPEAMHAALQVLSKFRRLAESHRVDETIAVATSAVREAENGGEFLQAIAQQTGIRARVISGTEEARLIHLAAAYGTAVPGEIARRHRHRRRQRRDHARHRPDHRPGPQLQARRHPADRAVRQERSDLAARRAQARAAHRRRARRVPRRARAGRLRPRRRHVGHDSEPRRDRAQPSDGRPVGTPLRNRRVSAKQLRRVRKTLTVARPRKAAAVPGLEPRRADLAVAGAILLDTILRRLGANEITLCDLSLREGLVLDYIARHRKEIAQADRYPDVRRRSVIELAERCNYWPEHAQQVARLAIALFDQTRGIHGLTDREREWLEYAALLHDVGVHISYEAPPQALVLPDQERRPARLRARRDRDHRAGRALPPPRRRPSGVTRATASCRAKRRKIVRTLAAMLRLAESLDRSHAQTITGLELHDRGEDALLQVRTSGDAELELWAATRHVGAVRARDRQAAARSK